MTFIIQYSVRKYSVLLFYVAIRKILQMLDAFLSKESLKRFRRKPQGDSECSARNEYAPLRIATNGTKDIFECEPMGTRKSGASSP